VWLQPDRVSDDDAGVKLTWLGDVDGDGKGDLAVGLPAANGGAGQVAIVNGRGGSWPVPSASELLNDARSKLSGAPGAGIGALVAPAGDVNGDGIYDILVGDATNGRAFLILGGQVLGSLTLPTDGQFNRITRYNVPGLRLLQSAGDAN